MPRPFALPDLGEGLTEAEIVKVLVTEGDVIAEDAPLLEVETDKATVEIPSPFGGRVARVHVQPGQTVKVGDALVTFDDATVASSGRREPVAPATTRRPSRTPAFAPAGRGSGPAAAPVTGSDAASRGTAAVGSG